MPVVFIVTKELETARKIQFELSKWGFKGLLSDFKGKVVERVVREVPELLILEMDGQASRTILQELTTGSRIRRKLPILVLMTRDYFNQSNDYLSADDFIVLPFDDRELVVRARRLAQKKADEEETFTCGDLSINLANCEVRIAGRIVELTFKEYELLTFLARERGRVFTRESLLNKVWGYDYFGGDRTVDVHIRRLRSKIEVSDKTYIETVRNIGYRFTTNC